MVAPHVAGRKIAHVVHAERAGEERTASGLKATKDMPSSRQVSSTAISAFRVHSEYSVWTAVTGCTLWARRIVSADISESPYVLILAFLDQFGKGADTVLDRYVAVEPVQIIEIDDIGFQTAETVLAGLLDPFRIAVDITRLVALARIETALAGEEKFFPGGFRSSRR